jgi:hypothetical protein
VIWKRKAGKVLPVSVAKELIEKGRTEKPISGFRGRSGRSFRAKLKLVQDDEGKWRVDFDEEWATGTPREAEEAARAGERSRDGADDSERRATRPEAVEASPAARDGGNGRRASSSPRRTRRRRPARR